MNQELRKGIHTSFIGVLILVGLGALTECSFRIDKDPNNNSVPASSAAPPPSEGNSSVILGYYSLKARIFDPRCFSCHSASHGNKGGINLETYASTYPLVEKIREQVIIDKTMPPKGPLSESDQNLIQAWVNAGAPENDIQNPNPELSSTPVPPSSLPSSTPSASPSPLPSSTPTIVTHVTYAEINSKIFTPLCLKCHDPHGTKPPRKGVTVDTYMDVMKNISKIQQAVLVDQSMPPDGPLSDETSSLLQTWINQGEPQ